MGVNRWGIDVIEEATNMKFKNWTLTPCNPNAAAELESAGIPPLSALVLAARGFDRGEQAKEFLSCAVSRLHDPMTMKGMPEAVERIGHALAAGETICVYGDYDVDGITATCLLTDYLRSQGGTVIPYVPDRIREGYSLNPETIDSLAQRGVTLIITVDCGITNLDEVAHASSLGLDVVITDHHECKEHLPDACAIVNPHQPDCPYPFQELAGVGVALKLVLALGGAERQDALLLEYADLAAIGTVADVMQLTGENRSIVTLGLNLIPNTRRVGLAMLLKESRINEKPITASFISFSLAPRINAAGRMGCPFLAVDLLLTDDPLLAAELAQKLCQLNRERQLVEQDIFSQCTTLLDQRPALRGSAIVLAGENWHQGVVGIVASRLAERYGVPTFMICLEGDRGKGSCRSSGGFPLFSALEQCSDLLEGFGGHAQAAGFTITAQQIPAFRRKMCQLADAYAPLKEGGSDLVLDAVLPNQLLTLENVEALEALEPFGTGNPRPTFLVEHATLLSYSCVGGGRHTRMQVDCDGVILDAIFFSTTPRAAGLRSGMRLDLACYPQVNQFRGCRTVQLLITDIRRALSPAMVDLRIYQRFRAGEVLSNQELLRLLPQRQDFVATWRYLAHYAGDGTLIEQPLALSNHIARTFGLPCGCSRTLICLDVLQERGLIDLAAEAEVLRISLRQVQQKVDLNDSTILQQLHQLLEDA